MLGWHLVLVTLHRGLQLELVRLTIILSVPISTHWNTYHATQYKQNKSWVHKACQKLTFHADT